MLQIHPLHCRRAEVWFACTTTAKQLLLCHDGWHYIVMLKLSILGTQVQCFSFNYFTGFQYIGRLVAVNFLAYVNISQGTADHIYNAVVQALENNLQMTKETIFTKLVGFGSDGASVMTGYNSGVSTRLKREQPLLFTMHCMAHRLELGFKATVGENSFKTTFSELLFSIYNFYH